MDFMEIFRRFKRMFDTNYTVRRIFVIALILFGLIWLVGYRHLPYSQHRMNPEPAITCMQRKLHKYNDEVSNMDTSTMYITLHPSVVDRTLEKTIVPYVGNGYIGSALHEKATINIKPYRGRILNLPIPFRPIVRVSVMDGGFKQEAMVSQYFQGVVHRISCIERGQGDSIESSSVFYAHRVYPSVLEQNISIKNPTSRNVLIQFDQLGWSGEPPFKSEIKKLKLPDGEISYVVGSGIVETETKGQMAVVLAYKKVPNAVEVESREFMSFRFVTVVNYVYLVNKNDFESVKQNLLKKTEEELKSVLSNNDQTFFQSHVKAWKDLWNTGFYISPSRAENALNGDKINSTMYNVLSQVRAPLHEINVPASQIAEANAVLSYSEGCYGGHHTLQAPSLWTPLETEKDLLSVCNLWLLTLEKLGCHKLLKAGAAGVIQAMVLSFGALKFRDFHLEFNTEPKDLHRDYHFRRILYGNSTHVNISVSVGMDNKAVLFAALDRSDKDYYACDGGCLDDPIELGPKRKQLPVKLTDPVTSILYITSDRKHAEELHLSIHVKEILEAPAHEHHVISMHKHGSGYGAMSTMLWVVLSLLIVIFHLFLFHLVYTEYFGSSQEKYRSRKISDF